MFRQHWGDLPIIPDTESGIAALEREQITKPRALEIEGAKLHQLSESACTVISNEALFRVDPLVQHTIQLFEHNKKLRALLLPLQEQSAHDGTSKPAGDSEACMPHFTSLMSALPARPEPPASAITDRKPGDITNKSDTSDFILGKGQTPPELPFSVVHQLLRKTVAILCAHAGYETSSEVALDTFTSVLHQFFTKMCSLLRIAVDNEALTGSTGFVDPVEEVFHHMGLGSVTVLHHFYQNRVVGYHRHLLRNCKELEAEYTRLSSPKPLRLKQEVKAHRTVAEEADTAEIKFPVLEESDGSFTLTVASVGGAVVGAAMSSASGQTGTAQGVGGGGVDQSPPPLEELHGALQGMEGSSSLKEEVMKWLPPQVALRGKDGADATQPTLDPDEIINVSDTPEPASGSEMEQMPPSVTCDPLTLSPASDPMVQFCKPPRKKKKK